VDYWLPISQYIGGIDHATGHLLYSRFFVKAMNDWGMVGFREPFARVFHQGWVQLGGRKMSKTKGNVEGPDPIVDAYGADVVRRFQFHTPISAVMELVNELGGAVDAPDARFAAETAVSLIQPYAPHVAEELWGVQGHERLWQEPWPVADESQLVRETFELVVQVNGKVRDRFEVDAGLSEDELVERARASERVRTYLDGGEPRKTIVVPKRLVNFVI